MRSLVISILMYDCESLSLTAVKEKESVDLWSKMQPKVTERLVQRPCN